MVMPVMMVTVLMMGVGMAVIVVMARFLFTITVLMVTVQMATVLVISFGNARVFHLDRGMLMKMKQPHQKEGRHQSQQKRPHSPVQPNPTVDGARFQDPMRQHVQNRYPQHEPPTKLITSCIFVCVSRITTGNQPPSREAAMINAQ